MRSEALPMEIISFRFVPSLRRWDAVCGPRNTVDKLRYIASKHRDINAKNELQWLRVCMSSVARMAKRRSEPLYRGGMIALAFRWRFCTCEF